MEQSERGGGQGGDGAGRAGPCGPQGGLGLLPRGRRDPWRAVGRGGVGPDSGAYELLLATIGEGLWGGRLGAGDQGGGDCAGPGGDAGTWARVEAGGRRDAE